MGRSEVRDSHASTSIEKSFRVSLNLFFSVHRLCACLGRAPRRTAVWGCGCLPCLRRACAGDFRTLKNFGVRDFVLPRDVKEV